MAGAYTTATLLAMAREGLRDIGYQNNLLREEYEFADILAQNQPLRTIKLAAFAQEPPSYRSACIGIAVPSNNSSEAIKEYQALGAPQILALHPEDEKILRWKILAHGRPELIESIDPIYLRNAILLHQNDWNPEQVLRAKSIRFTKEPIQLDFFDIGLIPLIEERVNDKLDQLLRDVLAICKSVYKEYHATDPNDNALFRLVFRLVAAKLLGDRQHSDKWLSSNAQEVIREVEKFYFSNTPHQIVLEDIHVQNAAWKRIRTAFSFQNLSVEALAYVYENTLVSHDLRKKQSIHATDLALAEYIVQQLPFEKLPLEERRIFEPFAGHAPFLIAALSRLRNLLPTNISTEYRHDYFVQMLTGMEVDAFACEVAGYSLILADYPNPNGWHIETANIFKSPRLDDYLAQANVVLCNPPYERFTKEERKTYTNLYSVNKAVEALYRVLQNPPRLLGFVLPRTFIDGQMYVEARKKIANFYNNISLVAIPAKAFNYAKSETVLLIAHGARTTRPIWNFALVERKNYEQFIFTGEVTWQMQASPTFIENQTYRGTFNFWYTPLHPLWDALASLPRMGDIADIHRGIEYKAFQRNKDELISDLPHIGFARGLRLTTRDLEPYAPKHFTYFNMDPSKMLYEAYKLPWEKPKVIVNAGRINADRWLIAGVLDKQGLVCYQNFHGVWPKDTIPLEIIVALFNSPIANAFLSTHRTAWHNRKDTIMQIPVPNLRPAQIRLVASLVQEYISYQEKSDIWLEDAKYFESRSRGIIKQIDAELLSAYNLPRHLESELLKYFQGYKRPGLFSPSPLHASLTKRSYTSIMRVESVRNEGGNEMVEVALMNWNPQRTVRFPIFLVPKNLQAKLDRDVLLLAEVNVGAKKAEDLFFEAIRLAPEVDPDDGLA